MVFGHGEDDRLAGELARLILEARLHHFVPLLAQSVAVADGLFDVGAGIVDGVGVDSLLDQGVLVFLGELDALDALALETG